MISTTFGYVFLVSMAVICRGQGYQGREMKEWIVGGMPDPITRPLACGRDSPSFVCDPENLLPRPSVNVIDAMLKKVYNTTTVPCYTPEGSKRKGYLVMVAVVPKMKKFFTHRTKEDNIFTRYIEARSFAYHLGTDVLWGQHSSQCNEMVIILYSKEDNVLYTSTQSTARRLLDDETVHDVAMKTILPIMKSGPEAAHAIKYMATEYSKKLLNEQSAAN